MPTITTEIKTNELLKTTKTIDTNNKRRCGWGTKRWKFIFTIAAQAMWVNGKQNKCDPKVKGKKKNKNPQHTYTYTYVNN